MRVPVIATVTLAFVLNCPSLLAAQGATSPTNREGFDVVSIRQNTNGRGGSSSLQPGGRFVAINATVHSLIQLAYGVDGFRIVNAPGWSESERYDVIRWNPDPLNPAADPNVPSLLTAVEEQLGLRLQRREEPVEVVVVDRIDRPTENRSVAIGWTVTPRRATARSARRLLTTGAS